MKLLVVLMSLLAVGCGNLFLASYDEVRAVREQSVKERAVLDLNCALDKIKITKKDPDSTMHKVEGCQMVAHYSVGCSSYSGGFDCLAHLVKKSKSKARSKKK